MIARYSTCCSETRRGYTRSLSMVARLYPTTDPEHAEVLPTAGLITQQDIGGDHSTHINDAELRNAPDVTVVRRGSGLPIILITGLLFDRVNLESSVRQLYEIAELGKDPGRAHPCAALHPPAGGRRPAAHPRRGARLPRRGDGDRSTTAATPPRNASWFSTSR